MCGILSVINNKISNDEFELALDTLNHRGPDDTGVFYDPEFNIAFGHKRLSIIDLDSGHQPIFSEDKSIVLICNGELYDFERLRSELIARGHLFSTGSDSEIIIHLYEEYGVGLFEYLRGEFSFVLYDKNKKKVIAAKDRFGIKPLYYAVSGKGLIVSSEKKAIFASGLVKAEMDIQAIRDFILMVNSGSIFKGVHMLAPASYIIYDLAQQVFSIESYWDLALSDYETLKTKTPFDTMKDEVLKKFDEAITLRLRADVPVGVYLSGGIDSAAILASVAKQQKHKPKAFSISFSDDLDFDESSLAREMATYVDADYYEVKATKGELLNNFENMLWHTEGPTGNFHGVGKYLLSRLASQHVKVCLTGEGGDEVFLGYDYFKISKDGVPPSIGNVTNKFSRLRKDKKILKRLNAIKQKLGFQPLLEHIESAAKPKQELVLWFFSKKHRPMLQERCYLDKLKEMVSKKEVAFKSPVSQLQYMSLRHILSPYILSMLGDRQEMAHSLEGRTPLLDHHLFEYACQIPQCYKIRNENEKYIFKEANRDRVTKNIYHRQKWAYFAPPIPFRKGYHPTMDHLIDTYMSKDAITRAGIFNPRSIYLWMNIYSPIARFSKRLDHKFNSMLVYILSIQILHSHYCKDDE